MNKRERIIALRQADPKMILRKIAAVVGCSYQYAQQALMAEGLPTSWCQPQLCPCGNPVRYAYRDGVNSRYCSDACKDRIVSARRAASYAATHVILTCETCGGPTPPRPRSHVKYHLVTRGYQHTWCSKYCQGIWFGKNHGSPRGPRKVDAATTT